MRLLRDCVIIAAAVLSAAGTVAFAETTPLVDAAKRGDAAAVAALLDRGARVAEAQVDGATALHWASHHDDAATVRRLLEAGADVNAATDLGVTPLWAASQNGSAAVAEALLEAGADPNRALLAGETPLMVAARAGAPGVARLLLAFGADTAARGPRGQTAMMWAVGQHHADVVEVLLAHGAAVGARSDVWSQMMAVPPHGQPEYNADIPHGGNTALMFAARSGDLASARLLIAAGADLDDTNAWGVSAVTMAAHAGFGSLVALFLEAGADPDAAEAGFAAIHAAVMRRDAQLVATLLDHGADPNAVLRTWTPTRRASRDFHFKPALIGATPFWLAARFAAPDVMRLLAEHGADPLVVHDARYKQRYTEVRTESTTALMAAAGMGGGRLEAWVPPDPAEAELLALDAAQVALELGADLNATDAAGRTALDGARMARMRTVAAFLESRGARPGGAEDSDR